MTGRLSVALAGLALAVVAVTAFPQVARADAPGLQTRPLQYEDKLTPGHIKTGFVEVSNPGDSAITVKSNVQGFRQVGTDGSLEFFSDPDLAAGIKVDLTDFEVGPREAVRVGFTVDPAKLPPGGVYAAIFFRTVPPQQAPQSSYVSESANVGTLLMLTNGPAGPNRGEITKIDMNFWQFGRGLAGSLNYKNTDTSNRPHGFKPALTMQVLPWGATPKLTTGLVLPGVTRGFQVSRPGAYFGLLPVIFTDTDTHLTVVRWILVCTGWWQWALIALMVVGIPLLVLRLLNIFKRRHKPITKRQIDGLSSRK